MKKPIKNPFNIDFDDNPSTNQHQGDAHFGGNQNPGPGFQPGVNHRNAPINHPFTNNEEELAGVIPLDDRKNQRAPKIFNPNAWQPESGKPASGPSQLDENDDPPLLEGSISIFAIVLINP